MPLTLLGSLKYRSLPALKVGFMPSVDLLTLGVVWAPLFVGFQPSHNDTINAQSRLFITCTVWFLCGKAGEVLKTVENTKPFGEIDKTQTKTVENT